MELRKSHEDYEGKVDSELQQEHILDAQEAKKETNVGYSVYRQAVETHHEITPAQNRAVLLRLDCVLVPMFMFTQTLMFLDKGALNYANLFDFRADLNLHGKQFNWLSGIVFAGYFCGQYPLSYLIGKYEAQKVLGICIVIWGVCVITLSQAHNFAGAMVNRFIMGIFESVVTPGLTLMTGFWYTRQEIPLRQCVWYTALGWGGVIGSYLSRGIADIDEEPGKPKRWQYIFYILGAFTIAWGLVIYFFLPDSPATSKLLKEDLRVTAVQRVAGNQMGIKNRKFKKEQIIPSLLDPKTILIFISVFAGAIPNGLINSFGTIVIKSMGFSTSKTTLLTSVGYFVDIVALVVGGTVALCVKHSRLAVATTANIVCVTCSALLAYLPISNTWGRIVSFWFCYCQSIGFIFGVLMVTSNMGGYTHRSIASFVIFSAYCWGNVAGPFTVDQKDGPEFTTATIGLLVGFSIKTVTLMMLAGYMHWENKRRDRIYGPPDRAASEEAGMKDQTEFENKNFRYVL